jgi:membrane protein YqaA with SNARE-associated domain
LKIFSRAYEACIRWAKHRHAEKILGVMSFTESIFFPIPVDVMLAPMCLANLAKAWRYAFIATVTSVLGGIAGYFLGAYLGLAYIEPLLLDWGYGEAFAQTRNWFTQYGPWVVFVAGFAPIPYKVFTVTAGALSQSVYGDLMPFVIASIVGRAGRFFLVAGLLRLGGEKMEKKLHQTIDILGWGVVTLAVVGYLLYKYI